MHNAWRKREQRCSDAGDRHQRQLGFCHDKCKGQLLTRWQMLAGVESGSAPAQASTLWLLFS